MVVVQQRCHVLCLLVHQFDAIVADARSHKRGKIGGPRLSLLIKRKESVGGGCFYQYIIYRSNK